MAQGSRQAANRNPANPRDLEQLSHQQTTHELTLANLFFYGTPDSPHRPDAPSSLELLKIPPPSTTLNIRSSTEPSSLHLTSSPNSSLYTDSLTIAGTSLSPTDSWKFHDCLKTEQDLTDVKPAKRLCRERPERRAVKWVNYDERLQTVVDAYDDYEQLE